MGETIVMPRPDDGLFQWADYYRKLGCSVVPLAAGKVPAVKWKEFQTRIAVKRELGAWFINTGWGMALVCGAVSNNLVRIDFDDPKDYDEIQDELEPGPVFRSQRQGGGWGVLYTSTTPIPTLPQKSFDKYPKIEVRGEGSITVVPPTPGYNWVIPPDKLLPLVDVSAMLVRLFNFDLSKRGQLKAAVEKGATGELATLLKETTAGERSNNLTRIAGMLRARGIDLDTALQVMEHNFEDNWPQEGMSWAEAQEIFEGAWKRYEGEGDRFGNKGGEQSLGDLDESAPRIKVQHLSEIKRFTPKDILIPNVVLAGKNGNTLVAAPTKVGKTSLFLDAAVTASRGDPVWGLLPVPRALKIALIDQEQKEMNILDNQLRMVDAIGEPNDANILIISEEGGQFDIQHPAALDLLYRTLSAFGPDLVILDGWGWFVGHQASDPTLVKPALTWMKRLRQSLDCATIIIHHFKKAQFSSRVVDHSEFVDELDKIEGLKRLSDQAHTVLGYTPIPGYDTFNLLDGRTNYTPWDPPKTVIDYDPTTVTHKIITPEDGVELFDPETYRRLWTATAESRMLKVMLNAIMGRYGWDRVELANNLHVDKSQVSRWYSGQRNPSQENMAKVSELYKKVRECIKAEKMPRMKRAEK